MVSFARYTSLGRIKKNLVPLPGSRLISLCEKKNKERNNNIHHTGRVYYTRTHTHINTDERAANLSTREGLLRALTNEIDIRDTVRNLRRDYKSYGRYTYVPAVVVSSFLFASPYERRKLIKDNTAVRVHGEGSGRCSGNRARCRKTDDKLKNRNERLRNEK